MVEIRFAMRAFAFVVVTSLAIPAIVRADQPVNGPDLTGRWSGYWESDKNGHHGPLRASFRKLSGTCYRVTFSGRFWKVIPFIYSVKLSVIGATCDTVTLAGETPVGPITGTFRYDAIATACHFEARFTSKNDSGRFVLNREP